MWNHKRILWIFSLNQAEILAGYLKAQAKEGWYFDADSPFGRFFMRLKRGPAKDVQYSAVLFPSASSQEPDRKDTFEKYSDMCEECGWKHEGSHWDFQIFSNQDIHAVPIETEPSMQLEVMKQTLFCRVLPVCLMLLVLSLFHAALYIRQFADIAASNLRIMSFLLDVLVSAGIMSYLFSQCHWLWKSGRAIEKGRVYPAPSMRWVKIQSACLYGFLVLFLTCYWDSGNGRISSGAMLVAELFSFLAVLALWYVFRYVEKKRCSRSGRNRCSVFGYEILCLILFILIKNAAVLALTAYFPLAGENQEQVSASLFPVDVEAFGYSHNTFYSSTRERGILTDYMQMNYIKNQGAKELTVNVNVRYYETKWKPAYSLLTLQMKEDKGNAYDISGPVVNTVQDVITESYIYTISHEGFEDSSDYYLYVLKNGASILTLDFEGMADDALIQGAIDAMQQR